MKSKKLLAALVSCVLASGSCTAMTVSALEREWTGLWGDGTEFTIKYITEQDSTFALRTYMTKTSNGSALYAMDSYVYKNTSGSFHASTPSGVLQSWLNNIHATSEVTTSMCKGEVYYYTKSSWDECNLLAWKLCYYY